MLEQVPDNFPFPDTGSENFLRAVKAQATLISLPANTTICHQGKTCEHLPILVNGRARVYKVSENGKEITLYRIAAGESCVLTASCIMSDLSFPAIAVTETECDALVFPAHVTTQWFDEFPVWRQFIFKMVSARLASILTVIDEVAFQRMDSRLANYLINTAGDEDTIHTTHQQIADELGTAREVITRLLKDLEAENRISLRRGEIQLLDKAGLKT